MKKLQYLMVVLGSMLLGGCSDYFDVRPKSQVLAAELFSTEQGFDDQLVGVYKRLASTTLYGQEMTFGLMEAWIFSPAAYCFASSLESSTLIVPKPLCAGAASGRMLTMVVKTSSRTLTISAGKLFSSPVYSVESVM